jgi:hypothetical protein
MTQLQPFPNRMRLLETPYEWILLTFSFDSQRKEKGIL